MFTVPNVFGAWQRLSVSSPYIVMDVSDWHVQGIVFVVSCGNWYSGFVAPEYDGYKCAAMCALIFGNDILYLWDPCERCKKKRTYCLFPSPFSRHKIFVLSGLILCQIFLKRLQINLIWERWVPKNLSSNLARISKPNIILLWHPQQWIYSRNFTSVASRKTLPLHIADGGGIDCLIQVAVIRKGWLCLVGI